MSRHEYVAEKSSTASRENSKRKICGCVYEGTETFFRGDNFTWLEVHCFEAVYNCGKVPVALIIANILLYFSLCLRSIWALIITTAFLAVSLLLSTAYNSFMNEPTVIFTESTHNMIWNYPFPAITICNYNQISKSGVLEFVRTLYVTLLFIIQLLIVTLINLGKQIPRKKYYSRT